MSETRDESEIAVDVLSAHAQHLRDLAAVEGNPLMALTLQDAARRADRAASGYAKAVPPRLPDEPPDGTVLPGIGPNAWVRDDLTGAQIEDVRRRWWMTGKRKGFTWAEALQHGADPGRRLVELPDLSDRVAERALFAATDAILDARRARSGFAVPSADAHVIAAAVRALAERGNQ